MIRIERQWIANEYNPAFLQNLLASEFVHVLPSGPVTKAEQIAFVRTHPAPHFKVHRFESLEVRVFGDAAVATGTVLAVTDNGPPRRFVFTDVFVRRGGRWQAVNSQETPAPTR